MKITLLEMSMDRQDAMNRALDLSENFISHFDKIYKDQTSINVNHWASEMQSWLDKVLCITIKPQNKKLSTQQLMDWFLTGGSDALTLFEDEDEASCYDDFIDRLIINHNVKESLVFEIEKGRVNN